jgi:hypothetical protein
MSVFDPDLPNEIMSEAVERCTLKFLRPHQIFMLDEALAALGEFGEVRLVINKGRLRFVVIEKSYDAFKWRKGDDFAGNGMMDGSGG